MSVIAPAVPGMPIVSAPDEIRVMVVDDAAVVRSLLSRWIEETPGLKLVAALRNGREALERLDHAQARRRRARRRDARARRHLDPAEAAGAPPRSRRHHGVGADPRPRRGDAEGAVARRRRLHPEARRRRRRDDVGDVPARADRENPRARRCAASKRPLPPPYPRALRQSGAAPARRQRAAHRQMADAAGRSRAEPVQAPPVLRRCRRAFC